MIPETDVCGDCGLFVGDWDVHRKWHKRLTDTAVKAEYADVMTRPIGPGILTPGQREQEERQAAEWADQLFTGPYCFCSGTKHVYNPSGGCPFAGPVD